MANIPQFEIGDLIAPRFSTTSGDTGIVIAIGEFTGQLVYVIETIFYDVPSLRQVFTDLPLDKCYSYVKVGNAFCLKTGREFVVEKLRREIEEREWEKEKVKRERIMVNRMKAEQRKFDLERRKTFNHKQNTAMKNYNNFKRR